MNIVPHVPHDCGEAVDIEEQVVRVPVPVEICNSHQPPTSGKSRSNRCANAVVVAQVPNACCARVRVEQHEVRETVAAKVCNPYNVPTSGKSRTMIASDVNIIVQIPNNGGEAAGVEQ
jgi:hypothetical protein